jgi:hypothetical protein
MKSQVGQRGPTKADAAIEGQQRPTTANEDQLQQVTRNLGGSCFFFFTYLRLHSGETPLSKANEDHNDNTMSRSDLPLNISPLRSKNLAECRRLWEMKM